MNIIAGSTVAAWMFLTVEFEISFYRVWKEVWGASAFQNELALLFIGAVLAMSVVFAIVAFGVGRLVARLGQELFM